MIFKKEVAVHGISFKLASIIITEYNLYSLYYIMDFNVSDSPIVIIF